MNAMPCWTPETKAHYLKIKGFCEKCSNVFHVLFLLFGIYLGYSAFFDIFRALVGAVIFFAISLGTESLRIANVSPTSWKRSLARSNAIDVSHVPFIIFIGTITGIIVHWLFAPMVNKLLNGWV